MGLHFLTDVARFANTAHVLAGNTRKGSGEPYFNHPMEVANIVAMVTDDPFMIAAGYLHDTIEDAGITAEDIADRFGVQVAHYTVELTDVAKPEDGNRRARFLINLEHTKSISPNGKTIKLADVISNGSTMVEEAPGLAEVWVNEKIELLPHLKEGNPVLFEMAENTLIQMFEKLDRIKSISGSLKPKF